jgi:hypothetical protein
MEGNPGATSREDYNGRIKELHLDEPRQPSPVGLIIWQKEPTNLQMPFDQVGSYLTPTELF